MAFRTYSGPKGAKDVSPLEKSQTLFKEFAILDEAPSQSGRVPLLIEGDDGTRMDRRGIIDALRVGARERIGE